MRETHVLLRGEGMLLPEPAEHRDTEASASSQLVQRGLWMRVRFKKPLLYF